MSLNSEIMSTDSGDGDVLVSNGDNIESNENSSGCRPCDPLKVLKFVECLSATTSSIEMQILVNKYVSIQSPHILLRYSFDSGVRLSRGDESVIYVGETKEMFLC